METKYGFVSDAHGASSGVVNLAVKVLKDKGVDSLVLNGDLVGDRATSDAQGYLINMLLSAGRSGLETYVLFGSHEKIGAVEPILSACQDKYSNLIREPKVEKKGHDVVFLEGSDFLCGGEYNLVSNGELASGFYTIDDGPLKIVNMGDLKKYVSSPEKTVVVSHVPARFDGVEAGVDVAYFGEAKMDFVLNERSIEKGSVFPGPAGIQLNQLGFPVAIKNENRGNKSLKALLDELGVRKHVTGHFHESAHRAHDWRCAPVEEGQFVDELFWNASYLDGMKVGILTVRDGLVAYENVDLNGYV